MELSYFKLTIKEQLEMNKPGIIDKTAYQLNCLTECPKHKISYCATALNISPGELIRFE